MSAASHAAGAVVPDREEDHDTGHEKSVYWQEWRGVCAAGKRRPGREQLLPGAAEGQSTELPLEYRALIKGVLRWSLSRDVLLGRRRVRM